MVTSKAKVLIVDDDEDLHTLYGLYLQGQSYQILKAYDGKQGMDIVEKEKPDLIVLDMIMPVMGGEEFLTTLCGEKKIKNIPVIIASVNVYVASDVRKARRNSALTEGKKEVTDIEPIRILG